MEEKEHSVMDLEMAEKKGIIDILEQAVFSNRGWILTTFIIVSLVLGYMASTIRPEASFLKMIPTYHPFIQNYLENKDDLKGLGNALRIAVETTEGDIFDSHYLEVLKQVNDEVFFIRGIDRSAMRSLWTPETRWMEVTEEGFEGGPVMPDSYDGSKESIKDVRQNILRSGEIGTLVANNFKSSVVLAPLLDVDPDTGEALDYQKLSEKLEAIRSKHQSETIKLHIVGFAKVAGDLIDGLTHVAIFFAVTVIITLMMLLIYFKGFRSAVMPVVCSVVAAVWQLGLMRLFGYGLDPYSMLVPFLIFAIGVSHGVQMINGIQTQLIQGKEKLSAARNGFRTLFKPSFCALLTDGIGFATLLVIKVAVIQDLAVGASVGVGVLFFTNLLLLPVLMSYAGINPKTVQRVKTDREEKRHPLFNLLAQFTTNRYAIPTVAIIVVLYIWAGYTSRHVPIGDLDPGAPELRTNSRYNKDNGFMIDNYATSSDVFVVMVTTPEQEAGRYQTLVAIDRLQWELEHLSGVQTSISLVNVIKKVLVGYNEGDLKYMTLNRRQQVLDSASTRVPFDFSGKNFNLASVRIFLNDHKAETLQQVVDKVADFASKNDTAEVKILMAAGNSGIEAATNIEIEKAQYTMLAWVYGVVVTIVLITFRMFRAVLCVIIPLGLTTLLCRVLMMHLDIGVKVATLPVIALGVGVGVDYGIYIIDTLAVYLRKRVRLVDSYYLTMKTTGKAVILIGLTLAIGVCTWIFSPIKFQADMGLLLTFMFLFNMFGAIVFLPALAGLLLRAHTPKEYRESQKMKKQKQELDAERS